MKPVRLVAEARLELLHETRFYEDKRTGTGRKFREAVAHAFGLIAAYPGVGVSAPGRTRRTKVRGFPFTVVYRETASAFIVFAIAPDRRQPGYWTARDAGEE